MSCLQSVLTWVTSNWIDFKLDLESLSSIFEDYAAKFSQEPEVC